MHLLKKDIKTMKKPWITKGILKSINKKNKIYRKCIRTKILPKKRNCNYMSFLKPIETS